MANLVQIKLEPKSEPEDEVDTIEYEQPLNHLDGTFAFKVEKIEPDDEEDKVNKPPTYINRFGESVHNKQPCTSQMGTYRNETSPATVSHQGKAAKSNRKSTKMIGKSGNKRLAQKKQHKCKDCGYVTTISSNLKVHMRKHTGERPFLCDSCQKRFSQKTDLQGHMKVHASKDSMHCSGCLKIFATKEEKLDHESMCKQRHYECFLCRAYSTPLISILKVHMRIHSGVRPFQCGQCSKKFKQKSHLKKHIKTHSRRPKPRCSVCAQTFSKQSEMVAHEMNCNKPRYDCYLCKSYMSNLKNSLQLHMRMNHTGARPFKCGSCEQCYAAKGRLSHHIMVHKH